MRYILSWRQERHERRRNFLSESALQMLQVLHAIGINLISLVRRHSTYCYDIVVSTDWSTGLIFAMRSRYTSQTGNEALFDEADTDFSSRNVGDSSQGVTWATNRSRGTTPV
ncbi:MAG: hypothetical protein CM15mV8_1050 [Caudoviricetes sp.]|nr:MAG: hypothetical protein CM15mV8_1050 [Caudoviricetes sp.]